MPSDKEIREQQERHPGLRVWGAMPGGLSETSEPGDFPVVPFDDFIAAVAAAEQRVRDELPPNGADALWYLLGQRKGVQAARDAVANVPVLLVDVRFNPDDASRYVGAVNVMDALAAIDGVEKP